MLFGADGLISTVTAWKLVAILGFVIASALTGVILVFIKPQTFRAQLNTRNGKREAGVLTWLLAFYVPLAVFPALVATVLEYPPVLALLVIVTFAGALLAVQWRRRGLTVQSAARKAWEAAQGQERREILEAPPVYNPTPNGVQAPAPGPRIPTYVETPENTYHEPDARYLTPFPTGPGAGLPDQGPTTWGLPDDGSYWQRPAGADSTPGR